MKKIVFATIPMQEVEGEGWDPEGYVYRFDENKPCEYANPDSKTALERLDKFFAL